MVMRDYTNLCRVPSWMEILGLAWGRIQTDVLVFANTCCAWAERADQRRVLGRLDERMLKDVGLTRMDVMNEMGKPFWRL